ncbi:MAG TPA: hypothetical protein VFK88_02490 [Gallionella sp.]|nr:hypothetical protein [Gallionella sp.]
MSDPKLPTSGIQWPGAVPAFNRIITLLQRRGICEPPIDYMLAEQAAINCALYLLLAKKHLARPDAIERARLTARTWLVNMLYIAQERERIAAVTSDGLDADIVAICEPLPDA